MSTLFMGGPLLPTSSLQGTLSGQNVDLPTQALIQQMMQSIDLSGFPTQAELDEQIADLRLQGEQAVTAGGPPTPQPIPPTPSPLSSAGAMFASTLASSILRQPGLALQTAARIERTIRQAQDVENANFVRRTAFDQGQMNALRAFRLRALDQQIQALQEEGSQKSIRDALGLAATKEALLGKIKTEATIAAEKGKQAARGEREKDVIEAETEALREKISAFTGANLTVPGTKELGGAGGRGAGAVKGATITAGDFQSRKATFLTQIRLAGTTLDQKTATKEQKAAAAETAFSNARALLDLAAVPQPGDEQQDRINRVITVAKQLPGMRDLATVLAHPIFGPKVRELIGELERGVQ